MTTPKRKPNETQALIKGAQRAFRRKLARMRSKARTDPARARANERRSNPAHRAASAPLLAPDAAAPRPARVGAAGPEPAAGPGDISSVLGSFFSSNGRELYVIGRAAKAELDRHRDVLQPVVLYIDMWRAGELDDDEFAKKLFVWALSSRDRMTPPYRTPGGAL